MRDLLRQCFLTTDLWWDGASSNHEVSVRCGRAFWDGVRLRCLNMKGPGRLDLIR